MKVRMPDGSFIDVDPNALYDDDGQTPLNLNPSLPPAATGGRTFSEEDVSRIRQEEKDKLYSQIQKNNEELTALRDQVGSLTAAEQRREAQLEEERKRLESEARKAEEADLDAKSLIQRKEQEWQQQLQQTTQTWEQKFQEEREARERAEAIAAREREFGDLRDYTLQQVESNKDRIAPQLLQWITGNSREEVDAAINRAIETTDSIAAEMSQLVGAPGEQQIAVPGQPPVPPALPGTRVTNGPVNTDPAAQFQQLTQEQINNMPMDQYAKLRKQVGIGGQSNNRGLFG